MTNFVYKCIFIVFLMVVTHGQDNPCSTIFQYRNDNNYLYGRIEVPYPDNHHNLVELRVQISVSNTELTHKNIVNNIIFLGSADDLVFKRPLIYRLNFPPWCNILPQITLISVNNITLCSGTALQGCVVSTLNFVNKIKPLPLNSTNNNKPLLEKYADYSDDKCHIQYNETNDSHKIKRSLQWTYDFHIQNMRSNTSATLFNIQEKVVSKIVTKNDCGFSPSLVDHKTEIQKNTHPWMGALFRRELTSPKLLCGASLITPKLAITAGHCVAPYLIDFELYLTFGKTNLLDWFDFDAQTAKVQRVEIHPQYRNDSEDADIAMLIFTKELILTPTVQLICLWNGKNKFEAVASNEGVVVDWNKNNSFKVTQHLQHNYAVLVDEEKCFQSSIGITSNRTICAETRNNSERCDGYGGSAFYLLQNGTWTLRGIVSRSLRKSNGTCDLPQYVAVLDVDKYFDWISSFL